MLTDKDIDRLIEPLIERQQNINTFVLEELAKKIKEIGKLSPSDVHKLISLRASGADAQQLVNELARLSNTQIPTIKSIIREVALDAYMFAKPFYDFRNKSYIPFEDNIILQRRINAIARQTANTYKNLSNSTAFMIRDLKNPNILKPTPLSETYQTIIDEAIQSTQSGTIDYSTAMRRSIQQLVNSGLREVQYDTKSGKIYTQRLDTAVRRNILDGIRQINQEMQNIIGEEIESDGVEISVHSNPAKDHAEMQGHQYTKEQFDRMQNTLDFEDIQGRKYSGFERAIGTWNCRHIAMPIVIGVKSQNYTDEQLQEILKSNEDGYTLPNGKHLTMYECTQYQRKLEVQIRKYKDLQITARTSGDTKLAKKAQAKINAYTLQYNQFSKDCGLTTRKDKTTVSGYRKMKTN